MLSCTVWRVICTLSRKAGSQFPKQKGHRWIEYQPAQLCNKSVQTLCRTQHPLRTDPQWCWTRPPGSPNLDLRVQKFLKKNVLKSKIFKFQKHLSKTYLWHSKYLEIYKQVKWNPDLSRQFSVISASPGQTTGFCSRQWSFPLYLVEYNLHLEAVTLWR